MDPCPLGNRSKSDPNLANLEKHKDQDCPSKVVKDYYDIVLNPMDQVFSYEQTAGFCYRSDFSNSVSYPRGYINLSEAVFERFWNSKLFHDIFQIVKSCSHAKHNIRNSKPDLDNLGKDEEQVLAPEIIDPCPHAKHHDSRKLEQHLAKLEKHRDKDWPSENKDPSSHNKKLVRKDAYRQELIMCLRKEREYKQKQEQEQKQKQQAYEMYCEQYYLRQEIKIWVPNSDKRSFEENVACLEKINELVYRQQKQVRAYKGFHIDEDLRDLGGGLISPVDLDDEYMNKIVKDAAVFAVEKYNQTECKDLELERVVKANSKLVAGYRFYLTLEANDGLFYEAKVYCRFGGRSKTCSLFRLAKYYPLVSKKKKNTLQKCENGQ